MSTESSPHTTAPIRGMRVPYKRNLLNILCAFYHVPRNKAFKIILQKHDNKYTVDIPTTIIVRKYNFYCTNFHAPNVFIF
jgi:hypothetical protein